MSSNPDSSNFNYKDYSLEKLEEWMHDAMNGDASPHEIYSTIRDVVREDYQYHKDAASRAFGLLELLSGHRPVADQSVLTCDKDDPSPECKKFWNDFWEGVDDEVRQSLEEKGYEWTPLTVKDKVIKWQLPVEADPSGEYFVTFPDDLLEAADLKEGDTVEWVDNGDGSYLLRKV